MQPGYTIRRTIYALDGSQTDPQDIILGRAYIVVLQGAALEIRDQQTLVVDLLPAGMEVIETGEQLQSEDSPYPWLPQLSQVRYQEGRDDRFVAALDLQADEETHRPGIRDDSVGQPELPFTLAYMVHASAAGVFAHPPVHVEDMYQPETRGSGQAGTLIIQAP